MLSMVNALMAVFVRAMGIMGAKATAEPKRVEARTVFIMVANGVGCGSKLN